MLWHSILYFLVVLFLLIGTATAVVSARNVGAVSDDVWNRTHRVFAYEAPRRARYPSLALDQEGRLLLLLTQISQDQEQAGQGDVVMIRSADKGETWSAPTRIYEGKIGEPRTMGTLARLSSGKLLAVVAEFVRDGKPEQVRLLSSENGGESWEVSGALQFPGVNWASPYGRLVEGPGDVLLMPVEAELPRDGGKPKISVGLMRSIDGGKTWGDFSLIALGFRQPTVLTTDENSLVAIVHASDTLHRSRSVDGGFHWTDPEQILLGEEPYLVRITDRALACVSGARRISFSYDHAESWRCQRTVGIGNTGHSGWPTALATDADHVLIAFGRSQVPNGQVDLPLSRPVSEEEERIEVVFFERDREAPPLSSADWNVPPDKRDRWEYVESRQLDIPPCSCRTTQGDMFGITTSKDSLIWLSREPDCKVIHGPSGPEQFWRSSNDGQTWQKHAMNLPGFRGSPGPLTQLASGRLLCAVHEYLLSEWNDTGRKPTGEQRGGYALWSDDQEAADYTRLYVIYSDDEGKTWQGTEQFIDFSPLQWATTGQRFIEQTDGTIILPIWGCLNEEDARSRWDAGGLIRSTDGGKSWGDFSLIASQLKPPRMAYNEIDIVPISDKLLVAFVRTEPRINTYYSWMSRVISTDGGYTWSQPELSFDRSVPGAALLPDGGIVLGHSGAIRFSYDLGRTWTRVVPAAGYALPMLIDDDTLLVSNRHWSNGGGTYAVWRRIAAGKGQ